MAIGRITGQMLSANLARSGTDLTFETNLLALDVTNSRIGIGTTSPATTLHVSATDALRLPSGNTAQRPGSPANGDIRYNSTTSQIEGYAGGAFVNLSGGTSLADADTDTQIEVERSSDEDQIHFQTGGTDRMHIRDDGQIELNNLNVNDQTITGLTTNGDIVITPNGTGRTTITNLTVAGSFDMGDLNALNVGDSNVDSVSSDNGTDFDLLLDDNQAAALEIKEGSNAYMTFTTTNSSELITANQSLTVAADKTFTATTAQVNGDITVNGQVVTDTITSAASNANIAITPSGTGEVDISKVDIDDGAIDGTVIGANSAAAGTFTSLNVSDGNITNVGDINVDSVSSDNGTDFDLLLDDNQASALEIKEGSNAYMTFTTTNSSELITVSKPMTIATGQTLTTDTADINGGAIDGTTIGANSAAAATFTNLTANGEINIDGDGSGDNIDGVIIGANSAAAGTFTTIDTSGNATIGGNLTVNGTTTTIDSQTLTVEDPLIQLAKNNSGGAANTFDQGLFFNRGSDDNVSFIWDESADEFAFAVTSGEDGTTAGNVTIDSYANIQVGTLTASTISLTGVDISGNNISASRSNDDLVLAGSGTGVVLVNDTLSLGENNITNVGDINVDSVSSDNGTDFDITLDDNQANALEIKEGSTAYLNFATTNSSELITANVALTVASGVTFTTDTADINGGAIDGTTIGANSAAAGTFTNLTVNTDVNITDSGGDGTIDGVIIGGTTAAAGTFTSIAGTSLSVGDGNVTNVGDIALDTISADGTTIGVSMTDNTAAAFDIKEGSNSYLKFDTTDSSELITAGKPLTVATGQTFTTDTADINGGAIDGTTIGANSAAAATFTTATATSVNATNVRANDGTAAIVITDSTGAVAVSTALSATGNVDVNGGNFTFNEDSASVDARFESNGDTHALFIDGSEDHVGIRTSSPAYDLDISGSTDALRLPQGNTAQRPTGATGIIRFNSQTGKYEGCTDGSTYVDFAIAGDAPTFTKESTTGDGSTTTFSGFFSSAPESANNVFVYIDNVYQEPTENYSVSGTNITFTSAPHSGARIFAITGADNTALVTGGIARSETSSVNFTSSATTIMSFNAATYRGAELFISLTDSANTEYSVMKANVVHDGSTAYGNVYGVVNSGSTDLATITFVHDGSNTVNVQAVTTGGQTAAKVQYSLVA